MGLSASQARLLTITARKADCEFLSMTLSHQKLSLSRDMQNISSEYQEALNATKLVYDYQGSAASQMPLTYGLLMQPSIYNDYYPKLVTDPKNRVILNSAYAAAARAAGIPAEGLSSTPSSDVRNKFIEALVGNSIITPAKGAAIQGVAYGNTIGLGSTYSVNRTTTDYTYEDLINAIRANTQSSSNYFTLGAGGLGGIRDDKTVDIKENERLYIYNKDGNIQKYENPDWNAGTSINLADLFSGNEYYISYLARKGAQLPIGTAFGLQEKFLTENGILDWMLDQFTTVLGGSAANDTALQYAYNTVYDLIKPNDRLEHWASQSSHGITDYYYQDKSDLKDWAKPYSGSYGWFHNDTSWTDELRLLNDIGHFHETQSMRDHNDGVMTDSKGYLGFCFTGDKEADGWTNLHKDRDDKSQVSVNLNNIAQAFLTSYVQYMEGVDTSLYGWQKGDKKNSVLYDGTDKNFVFTVPNPVSEDDINDNDIYATFYDAMFNMLCTKGWTENAQIDDEAYIAEMMKNGMAYISTISDDGYYYQGNFSTDKNILEVSDTEAISKAQAKYNTEKAKIENKEQTIDLKMKNLDTEITSLTTEYDTTKQVISKAIEKSFKRYDA